MTYQSALRFGLQCSTPPQTKMYDYEKIDGLLPYQRYLIELLNPG